MHCDPACWGCTAAGVCPKEQTPAVAVPPTPRRWTPDRLAYQRLGCGHLCSVIPIVNDIFSIKEVWCPDCKCWVKPPAKKTTTTRRKPVDPNQEEIPF